MQRNVVRRIAMTRRIFTGFDSYRMLLALMLLLGAAAVSACTQPVAESHARIEPKTPPANPRIRLNTLEMGFASDTSLLREKLTKIMQERELTGSIKHVVFRAEKSLTISEVVKIMQAVAATGAKPHFAWEVDDKKADDISIDPLMLVVTAGDPDKGQLSVITEGVKIMLTEFTLKHSERDSLPKEFVGVEITEDGSYIIGGKPVPRIALKGELQARFKQTSEKRVVAMIGQDTAASYDSLKALADAAYEAQAELLQLLTLVP